MKITVRFFAHLREQLGAGEDLEIPHSVATVSALREHLLARGPAYAGALAHKKLIRMAVNQEMVDGAAAIKAGDEVAFFPPVTGG
jgi:molybdopterin synthase sulfur carrier subunit